ncbi:hypothetical protein E8E12_004830 [Didymella heteroderae]|uniref:Uncharacterized protein n=1 Tax=Didymella heteroderae TaxID=1769908 RepID=A0A9P4WJC5_9PLEO|nr:hypothetical protein E8E12_004830 [Didymella heteroderae]
MLRLKLYCFASRFIVPRLRQQLNRVIVNDYDADCPCLEEYKTITYVFNNLPPTDLILDSTVDRYFMVWRLDLDEGEDEGAYDHLPREFLLRFYKRVDFCSYHEHITEADKIHWPYKTKKMGTG